MDIPPSPVCQSVEMDVYLGQSEEGVPSFLCEVESDVSGRATPSSLDPWGGGGGEGDGGMVRWPSCDSLLDLPACIWGLTSDPCGGEALEVVPTRVLKRKKALMKPRLAPPSSLPSPSSLPALPSPFQLSSQVSLGQNHTLTLSGETVCLLHCTSLTFLSKSSKEERGGEVEGERQ